MMIELPSSQSFLQTQSESTSSFNINDLPCCAVTKERTTTDDEIDSPATTIAAISSLDECVKESSNTTKKTRKSVSFLDVVKFREIRSCKVMNDADRAKLWYSSEDLQDIKRDAHEIVELLNNGIVLSSELGQRGILHFCQAEKLTRYNRRIEAYMTVFLMQEVQQDFWALYEEHGDITEAIAQRYRCLSNESKEEALLRAMNDQGEEQLES